MNSKFEKHFEQELFKSESQDRVNEENRDTFEWTKLGTYERELFGRQLSFEKHGEVLGIESQKEWDKHVAKAEAELFQRMDYHCTRIASNREMKHTTQTQIDERVAYATERRLAFAWHFEDIEKNGTQSEMHQDWLVRQEKGHGPDLDYFIRDDIATNETTVEFGIFRCGMSIGYDEGLADVAHVEDTVPELVEIRGRLRGELIEAVKAHFVSEFGTEVDDEINASLENTYVMNKPIAQLVKMIASVKEGKLLF